MKTRFLLTVLVFVPGVWLSAQQAELREFTNTKGIKIKARVVSAAGGQVTIVRGDGQQFTIPAATLVPADQEFIRSWLASAGKGTASGPVSAVSRGPAGPNDKLSVEDVNAVTGQPLFAEAALWDSPAEEVAGRMKLRPESKTKVQSSFRSYTAADFMMFGAHPYSVALYAENEKVTSLSLVFANKGDLFGAKGGAEKHFDKDAPPAEAAKMVREAMDKDLAAISAALTGKLGAPRKELFGERGTARMKMQRWDWRGHAILLAEAEDEGKNPEYVGVQIVTAAFADAGGKAQRTPEAIVRDRAKACVQQRTGGDVVVTDIPMVDQGPKGYCVPATAERAMRHLSVPADMYVLANAGQSGYGGGTSVNALLQGMGRYIRSKGRTFDEWDGEIKIKEIAKHIDKGVPVIWALFSSDLFNKTANDRLKERKEVTDWAAWKSKMESAASSSMLVKDEESAHVVLIMGYNKDTNEIAFSDSWGERFTERWITIPEAEKVSQQRFYVIGF